MPRKKTRVTSGDGWTLVRSCPRCGRPEAECRCERGASGAGAERVVRIAMERRRGKPVTVLRASGFDERGFREMVADLKATLATGGSASGLEAMLQGDHRERVRGLLRDRGVAVKG